MRYYLILLYLIVTTGRIFADASPFYSNAKIDIEYSGQDTASLLECCVIYESSAGDVDTSCSGSRGAVFIAACNNDRIKIIRIIPERFRLILRYSSDTVTTPELSKNGMNTYHRILISGSTASDITPPFNTTYSNYSIALIATIVLEMLVAAFFFLLAGIPLKYTVIAGLMNLITHPVLWLITSNITGYGTSLIVLEAVVTAVEGYALFYFLRGKLSLIRSLALSIVMNAVSFFIGGAVYLLYA